jgi:hypothetical protein
MELIRERIVPRVLEGIKGSICVHQNVSRLTYFAMPSWVGRMWCFLIFAEKNLNVLGRHTILL